MLRLGFPETAEGQTPVVAGGQRPVVAGGQTPEAVEGLIAGLVMD